MVRPIGAVDCTPHRPSLAVGPGRLPPDIGTPRRAGPTYSKHMERRAALLMWRVTRLLLATGGFAVATGILGILQGASSHSAWLLIVLGIALVVVSTSGRPVDEAVGRDWSVLSARVRPFASGFAILPITPLTPRGVSPPRA